MIRSSTDRSKFKIKGRNFEFWDQLSYYYKLFFIIVTIAPESPPEFRFGSMGSV